MWGILLNKQPGTNVRWVLIVLLVMQARTVRLPVHMSDLVVRINRVREELGLATGKGSRISDHDVGEAMGLAPAKVSAYLKAARPPLSLEAPASVRDGDKASGLVIGDLLTSPAAEQPDVRVWCCPTHCCMAIPPRQGRLCS